MEDWANFFTAEAGAAATLTGLLFVAISISLTQILQVSHLPSRAFETLVTLMSVLFVATIGLIPHQPVAATGAEMALTGLVTWTIHLWALAATHQAAKGHPRYWLRVLLSLFTAPPFIIGGALIAAAIPGGVFWVAAGTLIAFAGAMISSWVLLIEINR